MSLVVLIFLKFLAIKIGIMRNLAISIIYQTFWLEC